MLRGLRGGGNLKDFTGVMQGWERAGRPLAKAWKERQEEEQEEEEGEMEGEVNGNLSR